MRVVPLILPLFLYILWLSPWKGIIFSPLLTVDRLFVRFLTKVMPDVVQKDQQITGMSIYLQIIAIVLCVDIFLIKQINNLIILIILLSWAFILFRSKMGSIVSFITSMFLLIMIPFLLYFEQIDAAEKAVIWMYLFLFAGAIQSLLFEHTIRKYVREK